MNTINLNMLHSPYRVVAKECDEGHGGQVPPDYQVQNNAEFVCTVSSSQEAQRIRDTYNQMRLLLLEQLLNAAKGNN